MDIFRTQRGESPIILSMPHSGLAIPPTLANDLTPVARTLPDTDWHIPRLYQFAQDLDATIIQANYSRYVIDLNRPPDNENLYPGQARTGLCPVVLFNGDAIYHKGAEPDDKETDRRRRQYWDPYHAELVNQIDRVRQAHGYAIVYDCHSIRSVVQRLFEGELPSLNLGTAEGASCADDLQQKVAAVMSNSGYSYAINGRFKGGFITRHYGEPAKNVHLVQMELAQSNYMEESVDNSYNEKRANQLQKTLTEILQVLLHWRPGQFSII
jgi:N-formylglutamate deformylase